MPFGPVPNFSVQDCVSSFMIKDRSFHPFHFSIFIPLDQRGQCLCDIHPFLDLLPAEITRAEPLVTFTGIMFWSFPIFSFPCSGFLHQCSRLRVCSDCLLGGLHLVLTQAAPGVQDPLVGAIPFAGTRKKS